MLARVDNSLAVMLMSAFSAPLSHLSTVHISGGDKDWWGGSAYAWRMDNHLRAWREFRGLTQGQVADLVGTATGVISLLESGKRPLSDKWLRKLAEALGTRAGHILDVNPADLDNDIIDIWTRIDVSDRKQAATILRSFVRTGTEK
jgi:transcriptional regulator with XRE-family HTH domain